MMNNTPPSLQAELEKTRERAYTSASKLPMLKQIVIEAQAKVDATLKALRAAPMSDANHDAHVEAKSSLRHHTNVLERITIESGQNQAAVARLERLANADTALATARELWRTRSDAQVAATKTVEAARASLRKLDALLSEEEGKSQAAKAAQRTAILGNLGFSDKPAGESVSEIEKALVGSAAKIDALRSARPDLEAAIATAEAKRAACDAATRQAEQDILDARHAIADREHAYAKLAYVAAWVKMRAANLAATGRHMMPIDVFHGISDTDIEARAQRLKAQAVVGE